MIKTNRFVSLLLIFIFSMTYLGCGGTELQHGLSEEQANEVLVVLQQTGINAKKVREQGEQPTWAITVPNSTASKAWKTMKDHDLPRAPEKGFSETFSQQSLIPTATEEKALYLQALCNEIQKTIESIDGIVKARVHLVLPEEEIIPQENPVRPKAAVLIKYKLNAGGEVPYKDEAIRLLVANSIQKLDPKDVAVVGTEMGVQSYSPAGANAYVWVGPLKIAPDSLNLFKIAGVVVAFLIALLALGLILSARKSSSLKSEIERLSRSDKLAKVAG